MFGSVVFGNKVLDAHALVLKPVTEPSSESPAQGWRPLREAAGSHHLVAIVPASGDHAALAAAAQPINSGPGYLVDWLVGSANPSPTFPADYLLAWGARYSPAMTHGQAYRWLSGLMLHLSSWHVGSNLALLLLLGVGMERSLGSLTLAAAWLLAALGGAFLSAALEDPCVQICGSSGAVLGLLGMRFVKLALTWSGRDGWDKEQRPLLSCTCLAATLVAFLATTLTQPLVSHMSHLGGFLAGGAFAGLALPLHHSLQQWRAGNGFTLSHVHVQVLSALALVALLGVVPAWVYARVLPNVECAAA
ncbi:hypothetical protein V8C86DRAFT_3144311 [Haematococcus lacustris]